MSEEFPVEGVELTFLLVVSDLSESVTFYRDVLGGELFREYGGTSAVFDFQGSWLLLVTGGPPTQGKPGVTFAPPEDPSRVDHQLTLRVPDCWEAYETLRARGAEFLTPSVEREHEIRCILLQRAGLPRPGEAISSSRGHHPGCTIELDAFRVDQSPGPSAL